MDATLVELLAEYPTTLLVADGRRYLARARGYPRSDGLWEGYLEFQPEDASDGARTLRTSRETTQPNRADLVYWAGGITPVYLEGALSRAIDAVDATEPFLVPAAPIVV